MTQDAVITAGFPILTATGPGEYVSGWRYLWLKYVRAFKPDVHCARCLVGPYSKRVSITMRHGVPAALDEAEEWDAIYLCGVAMRGGWAANLHLAAAHAPGETAAVKGRTGDAFIIQNALALPIPGLPAGFDRRGLQFTTCRNWQFGVSRYGLSSTSAERHAVKI